MKSNPLRIIPQGIIIFLKQVYRIKRFEFFWLDMPSGLSGDGSYGYKSFAGSPGCQSSAGSPLTRDAEWLTTIPTITIYPIQKDQMRRAMMVASEP